MPNILVYVEANKTEASERLLRFARAIARAGVDKVIAVSLGDEGATVVGADVLLSMAHHALQRFTPEAHVLALAHVIRIQQPALVLVDNTSVGLDVAGATAAATDLPLVAYGVNVGLDDDIVTVTSQMYGGRLVADVVSPLPTIVSVNAGSLPEASATVVETTRVSLEPPAGLEDLRTVLVEEILPEASSFDITKARRLVCVGRGIGSADDIDTARELADALGAELAASRPVVDAGWLPKTHQVGKSGATVAPDLYLALGVSGAPEHLEGMARAELVIAVNKDPNAAIFSAAHYGAVADLFDVAEALTTLLANNPS